VRGQENCGASILGRARGVNRNCRPGRLVLDAASSDGLRCPLYCGDADRPAIVIRCGAVGAAGAVAGLARTFLRWGELLGRDSGRASVGCCPGDGVPCPAVESQVVMGRNVSRPASRVSSPRRVRRVRRLQLPGSPRLVWKGRRPSRSWAGARLPSASTWPPALGSSFPRR
jgi:hypothetical protein